MLKIKDNIDLKELEKVGWRHNGRHSYILHSIHDKVHLSIDEKTKKVEILSTYWEDDWDILYDLIKADLVEKVGE